MYTCYYIGSARISTCVEGLKFGSLDNIVGLYFCEIPTPITHTGKTLCKYGSVFAPYLHDWTLYGINIVQKRVRIYMAFFLCLLHAMKSITGPPHTVSHMIIYVGNKAHECQSYNFACMHNRS